MYDQDMEHSSASEGETPGADAPAADASWRHIRELRERALDDYRSTVEQTAALLAAEARIDGASEVLEVGGGCETLLLYLARWFELRGEGIFPHEAYVKFAQDMCGSRRQRFDIDFRQASVLRLPYEPGSFSHVVSHGALHWVPDKQRGHAEIYRVLRAGGVLAVSDFFQLRRNVSERTRRHVHDRFGWSDNHTLLECHTALEEAGFEIISIFNLDGFLKRTLEGNTAAARMRAECEADDAGRGDRPDLSSWEEVGAAVDQGEVGWATVVAGKPDHGT